MINIKDLCVEFGGTSMGQGDVEFVHNFPFNDLSINVREEDCYILKDNYVARKARLGCNNNSTSPKLTFWLSLRL